MSLFSDGVHGDAQGGGVTDHGLLSGLADNDHPQYRLVDDDVISRQTLGADAQDVTFAVTDTDESIEIAFFGLAASASNTIQINGGGTVVTYSTITQTNGGAPGNSSAFAFASYDGPLFLVVQFALKNLGSINSRVGLVNAISKSSGSATRDQYRSAFVWPDGTNPVTSVVIHSSVATGFKSGALAICRRRKFT